MNQAEFVAINYIRCEQHYRQRFEELFGSRAHAIDRLPGFRQMKVLKPVQEDGEYLIVSYWDSERHFQEWTRSPEFMEGHKRGFEDLRSARERGEQPPMQSTFRTYTIIAH